jgi:hypothetical protein
VLFSILGCDTYVFKDWCLSEYKYPVVLEVEFDMENMYDRNQEHLEGALVGLICTSLEEDWSTDSNALQP